MEIDLVYLWVDGNDPKWLKKQQRFLSKEIDTNGRYQDNQELKYSLRSIDKHLPWIRKIFILTDNQVPSFINPNHPKIEIIDHTQVIPKEILPTFNSSVIEHFIYKIPGLSEHYLYANDDMFVNTDLSPSFFFKDGIPVMRMLKDMILRQKIFLKRLSKIEINTYRLAIENAYNLFEKTFNIFYPIKQHHNIDAYLKSDYALVMEDVFKDELQPMFKNRFRHKSDIHRMLINYYAIKNNRGILTYSNNNESCRLKIHKNYQKKFDKYNPKLFCLNDSEHANDKDRTEVEPFLKKLFPNKAEFEK